MQLAPVFHADVGENMNIKVFVYDGNDTEPYTR